MVADRRAAYQGPFGKISFNLELPFVIQKQIQLLRELRKASLIRNQDCRFDAEQVIMDKGK